jgi:hypothetical protein
MLEWGKNRGAISIVFICLLFINVKQVDSCNFSSISSYHAGVNNGVAKLQWLCFCEIDIDRVSL